MIRRTLMVGFTSLGASDKKGGSKVGHGWTAQLSSPTGEGQLVRVGQAVRPDNSRRGSVRRPRVGDPDGGAETGPCALPNSEKGGPRRTMMAGGVQDGPAVK